MIHDWKFNKHSLFDINSYLIIREYRQMDGLDFMPLTKKTVHESDQISKQSTSAAHFHTYNLVRNEELIPSVCA